MGREDGETTPDFDSLVFVS